METYQFIFRSHSVDKESYTINFFDISNHDHYTRLRPLSYPQTDVFLLCFSITDPASLASMRTIWEEELQRSGPTEAAWILVGTHADQRSEFKALGGIDKLKRERGREKERWVCAQGAEMAGKLGKRTGKGREVGYVECDARDVESGEEVLDMVGLIYLGTPIY